MVDGAKLAFAVAAPPRHVRDGLKPVAVFRLASEDWSAWIALVRMRGGRRGCALICGSGIYTKYQ